MSRHPTPRRSIGTRIKIGHDDPTLTGHAGLLLTGDLIVGMVGLFTSWSDAISAGQRALDDRALRYVGDTSNIVTTDRRRNVTTESRRDSTK